MLQTQTTCEARILVTFKFHSTRNLHLSEVHLVLPTNITTHRNNVTQRKSARADRKFCSVVALRYPMVAHKKLKPVLSPQKHRSRPRVLWQHKAAGGFQQCCQKAVLTYFILTTQRLQFSCFSDVLMPLPWTFRWQIETKQDFSKLFSEPRALSRVTAAIY